MATRYQCPNRGKCGKADSGALIQSEDGSPAACPECGSKLAQPQGGGRGLFIGAGALMVLLLGVGILLGQTRTIDCAAPGHWDFVSNSCITPRTQVCTAPQTVDALTNRCQAPTVAAAPSCTPPAVLDPASNSCQAPKAAAAPHCNAPESLDPVTQRCKAPAAPPAPVAATLLRFHGSNTIGGKLLPALAEAFLKAEGYTQVHRVPGAKDEEVFIVGERDGAQGQIAVEAHGSKTAFTDLKSGSSDIGMSSRPIKSEERQALLPTLGDLSANASEHVLALDGIAVIVHPANPVKTLTLVQLADIFSGTLTDWSQVGGTAGAIAVYARDHKSGTWDFFNEAVLVKHGKTLAGTAQRFEDSGKLSVSVGADPLGIGFIGLNYVGTNKAIALADTGVEARRPSLNTVRTEDYLLSRRLFLYTAQTPANASVFKFIEFALSDAGQSVVSNTGLITVALSEPTPAGDPGDDPRAKSVKWRELTAKAAAEIGTRFRFRPGTAELDTRAGRDIGRVAGLIASGKYQGRSLMLIGFTDTAGRRDQNCRLSQERAEIVRQELAVEGLRVARVAGLCDEAPVASNDTPEGRERNRRVEVWVN
ncbi:phosphate ABC transporter substrate-binding/OmpA family protein [uncultured Thiodictyon sp.]|uniref:phosphate ABC transporter substrate-binding/OmpA family protein n=1 Tax=uncultured Thiodictyon sp. TaxID=1846217 RepID=UPI0025DE591A|nr:phosphate ABC transporter substrate-binding/OmpA family protein [uncultured Thiodictyon sp.]